MKTIVTRLSCRDNALPPLSRPVEVSLLNLLSGRGSLWERLGCGMQNPFMPESFLRQLLDPQRNLVTVMLAPGDSSEAP
jgi:hypothetical protein